MLKIVTNTNQLCMTIIDHEKRVLNVSYSTVEHNTDWQHDCPSFPIIIINWRILILISSSSLSNFLLFFSITNHDFYFFKKKNRFSMQKQYKDLEGRILSYIPRMRKAICISSSLDISHVDPSSILVHQDLSRHIG